MNKPEWLIIHHEAANNGFDVVNEYHRTATNSDGTFKFNLGHPSSLGFFIGYHYYMDKNGIIKQGRLDTDEGAHCIGYNTKSLGICCQGNFDLEEPTTTQRHNLRLWIKKNMALYSISSDKVVGHRKFSPKSCPGKNLTDQQLLDMANYENSIKILEEIKKSALEIYIQVLKAKVAELLKLIFK